MPSLLKLLQAEKYNQFVVELAKRKAIDWQYGGQLVFGALRNEYALCALLDRGVNVNVKIAGQTPLLEAIEQFIRSGQNWFAVDLILQHGGMIHHNGDRKINYPIGYAIYLHNCLRMSIAWRENHAVALKSYQEMTARTLQVLQRLVEAGDDVNRWQLTTECRGPNLHLAVEYEQKDIVEFLLRNGARIDKRYRGNTVLRLVIQNGNIKMLALLLKYKPKLNIGPDSLDTGSHVMTTMLLQAGADPFHYGGDEDFHGMIQRYRIYYRMAQFIGRPFTPYHDFRMWRMVGLYLGAQSVSFTQ